MSNIPRISFKFNIDGKEISVYLVVYEMIVKRNIVFSKTLYEYT